MKKIRGWKKYHLENIDSISIELHSILKEPACLFFEGEMGVGKTTFIKKLAYSISHVNFVSPTYSILIEDGEILHGDFYRLKNSSEITFLEIQLYCDHKNYLFFEWGFQFFEEIVREIPEGFNIYYLKIEKNDNNLSRNAILFEIFD